MERVIIVHRWDGTPSDDWYVWVAKQLTKKGYEVAIPAMPKTSTPKISKWVTHLKKIAGGVDKHTHFIGHSIGCQTIMRFLEDQKSSAGKIVFIAPWFTLQGLESKEEKATARPWLENPIDFSQVKKKGKFSAIFSTNDPYVSLDNKKMFEKLVGAKTKTFKNAGHFTSDDGYKTIPEVMKFF